MESSKRNRALFIDQEALSALALVEAGLLYPVTSLMNKAQSDEVIATGKHKGEIFPFPFILAPSGQKNREVLSTIEPNEELELICNGENVGSLIANEVFAIDTKERLRQIYGTDDLSHPGAFATSQRLGELAVSGHYTLTKESITKSIREVQEAKEQVQAQHVSAIMMGANPLHRAHERLIRQSLDKTDLVVIFLLKPYNNKDLTFDIRQQVVTFFIDNFLPKNRVICIPLESSYIFAGYNEVIIDAIVAKNYGCNRLVIGQNHAGVGMYYDRNTNKSIIDRLTGVDIEIDISSEYVYCDECKTLVSTKTCPHGQHHHISYHSDSILELLKLGILPPAVLMRKEVSALILSQLHPDRFKNLEKLYYDIMPVTGLLEEHSEKEFYCELMKLYQTTSLT